MSEEYILIDAYRLLRRIVAGGPQRPQTGNPDDDAACGFLLSRNLAVWDGDGVKLVATDAGRAVGRILRPG